MKLKKIFKNNIFCFILGALIFGVIGVSASTLLYSSNVTYDNTSSGLSSTTVQDALDELYTKAKSAPECDSDGNCTVTCPNDKPNYVATSTGYKCILPISTTDLTKDEMASGDGLYADSVESGRYIYRGTIPNNYITFNDETWRIISIESNGTLKIIRNEQLSSAQAWDQSFNRNSSTSTYCTDANNGYGCNAWAATPSLVGTPSTFTQYSPNGNSSSDSTKYSGTVTGNASLNTYLNGTYYSSLSSTAKAKMVQGPFNVSTPGDGSDTETLDIDVQQEKQYQWKGYVALMNVTELLRASTSSDCTSLNAGYGSSHTGNCHFNNWLWPTFNITSEELTLSPYSSSSTSVWNVNSAGYILSGGVRFAQGVRPVLYLSSSITLSGSGSSNDPYTIN